MQGLNILPILIRDVNKNVYYEQKCFVCVTAMATKCLDRFKKNFADKILVEIFNIRKNP